MSNNHVGAVKLRSLRKARMDKTGKRLTIEKLAFHAGFDYRTISDIERGVTVQPPLQNIQRIFNTLDQFGTVSVEDKNTVLQAYGYQPIFMLPTEAEIEHACQLWLEEYQHIHLPSYLISYDQRVLVWNRYAPRMMGLTLETLPYGSMENVRVFDMLFNQQLPSAVRLLNADELAPKLLALVKAELRPFWDEPWHHEMVRTASENYPAFGAIWESIPDDLETVSIRTVGPIRLQYDADTVLSFNTYGADFVSDPRFRVVQYHPADSTTIRIWNQWVAEEEATQRGG
ncbi:helix-turn-helix transcriptional regulator [bacterium]|nr:helix-turn-helix transcriptional regulator [bacterium]